MVSGAIAVSVSILCSSYRHSSSQGSRTNAQQNSGLEVTIPHQTG